MAGQFTQEDIEWLESRGFKKNEEGDYVCKRNNVTNTAKKNDKGVYTYIVSFPFGGGAESCFRKSGYSLRDAREQVADSYDRAGNIGWMVNDLDVVL